jgi:hypothetical protein
MVKEESKDTSLDENAVCERCGKFGAYHLGESTLCEDCYSGWGSCCLEFGADDLTCRTADD